jgi:putative membrane protein
MITSYGLATLNALLNSAALLCVILGVRAVRRRELEVHKRFMLGAFALSVVFLASYLTRIALFGDTKFLGQGIVRPFYFFVLITHVILAILVAPAVLYTVWLGLRDERARHRRWAPKVLPVWCYVLATGVLVYLLLHHWPRTPVVAPVVTTSAAAGSQPGVAQVGTVSERAERAGRDAERLDHGQRIGRDHVE